MRCLVVAIVAKLVVPLFVLAVSSSARAEELWEVGVSKGTRDKAQALFEEGNRLFAQQAHQPALEKYRAAIELWEHPLIRLNMAVTKVRLDRVLEAAADLDAALRFGARPFDDDDYAKAQEIQRLIDARVGHVQVSCDEPDAQVLLDGKPWFACPGRSSARVLAGEHVIVGEKRDFLTVTRRVVVTGGATATERLSLVRLDDAMKMEYPTPRWIPWTVAGVGSAVAVGGIAVWVAGRSQMNQFETEFAVRCPSGCSADLSDVPDLRREKNSAELKGKIAVSMLLSGGVVVAAGVIWGAWNRPKRVPTVDVSADGDGVAAAARWRF